MSSLAGRKKLLLPTNRQRLPLLSALRNAGLTATLQLCLDAGDLNSYASGQSWLDVSGQANDFFLGADGSATSTDPTFNGTAGRQTKEEYFVGDGGDFFRHDGANPTWIENLHKDSAAFTLLSWWYPGSAAAHQLFGTHQGSASNVGIAWSPNASNGNNTVTVANGSGTFARSFTQAIGVAPLMWNFMAISFDEAASSGYSYRNGVKSAYQACSYTSPSADAATRVAEIGAAGNGANPLSSGSRVAMFVGFSSALNPAQVNAIFNATRSRFGV